MKDLIKQTDNFKIIPNNFKSSGAFKVTKVTDDSIYATLILEDKNEANDYEIGSTVEVFGVNNLGLVYFETKILQRDGLEIQLALTNDYSLIQRREYSRVNMSQGKILFSDLSSDFVLHINDISAGGLKIITKEPLNTDRIYQINIMLSNNMKIDCDFEPIRISEEIFEGETAYLISGKFANLNNVDRIVLVQYTFKTKMEEQNKENN